MQAMPLLIPFILVVPLSVHSHRWPHRPPWHPASALLMGMDTLTFLSDTSFCVQLLPLLY